MQERVQEQHVADQRFAIELEPHLYLAYAPLAGKAAFVEAEDRRAAVSLFRDPSPHLRERQGDLLPDFLALIPTRACNISCAYCDFPWEGNSSRMPIDLGAHAIDWYAERCVEAERARLHLQFFGGEPFVAWPEVVTLCNHARLTAASRGLDLRLEAATNGVYPSEDRARWIADNFDRVTLSLDGPRPVQNELRGNSYDAVMSSGRIFRDGAVDLFVRSCVTNQTAARMKEIACTIAEELAPASVGFEPVKQNSETGACGIEPPDPLSFARGFADAVDALEPLGVPVVQSSVRIGEVAGSFCPVGNDGMVVSPDGSVASCYLTEDRWAARNLSLRYGQFLPDGALQIDAAFLACSRAQVVWNKRRCRDCFARWHCAGGCHVDHTFEDAEVVLDDLCAQTRLLTVWLLLRQLGLEEEAEQWLAEPPMGEVLG